MASATTVLEGIFCALLESVHVPGASTSWLVVPSGALIVENLRCWAAAPLWFYSYVVVLFCSLCCMVPLPKGCCFVRNPLLLFFSSLLKPFTCGTASLFFCKFSVIGTCYGEYACVSILVFCGAGSLFFFCAWRERYFFFVFDKLWQMVILPTFLTCVSEFNISQHFLQFLPYGCAQKGPSSRTFTVFICGICTVSRQI